MTTTEPASVHWGDIDGRAIHFPMVVERMNSATLTFSVPLSPAQALLPGDAFEVLETAPGQAMLILALVDYIENPWGDYDEVNFGLLAHPVGRPDRVGAFVWRMPVNQEFTMRAGNDVLGLPKTVEDLEFTYTDSSVAVRLAMDARPTLSVTLPRVVSDAESTQESTITFSYRDGVPSEVPLTIGLPTGVIDPADVVIELGDSPAADELRSLGLPTAPDFAAWGEGLSGTFLQPTAI